jgi:UDP-N-acetylmuramate--alanine ligase
MKRASTDHQRSVSGEQRANVQPFNLAGKSCFFVGIGGCGMSGLAREFVAHGARVQGVDQTRTETTASLEREGIPVGDDLPSNSQQPPSGSCDLLVLSAAIKNDHPLVQWAAPANVPTLTYAQALGRCMLGRTGVAVAGAHGKSTTVAMLAVALIEAGLDPSVIVGAAVPQLAKPGEPAIGHHVGSASIPTGNLTGKPGVFLVEACEFNRSFHNLRPTLASISSVEADHLDVYGTLESLIDAYAHFASLVAPAEQGGMLLIGHDGAHRREISAGLTCDVQTIGFAPEADWRITVDDRSAITLAHHGVARARWTCPMPGEHNIANSATAAALAIMLGADIEPIERALTTFKGVQRRMELLGDRPLPAGGAVRVYDDYGHHPTEVDATLRAIRVHERLALTGGRLVCVFQPHQHSRTRFLLDEFARAFSQADVVIVPDIYFVRDSQIEKTRICAADLVDRLRDQSVGAMHMHPFGAIVEQLEIICRPGDVLVVMGAGPVWKVARSFMAGAVAEPVT